MVGIGDTLLYFCYVNHDFLVISLGIFCNDQQNIALASFILSFIQKYNRRSTYIRKRVWEKVFFVFSIYIVYIVCVYAGFYHIYKNPYKFMQLFNNV